LAKADISHRAITTRDPPSAVILNPIATLSQEAAARMPTPVNLSQSIRHKRRMEQNFPVNPTSADEDFEIPETLKMSKKGENFLLEDVRDAGGKHRIFIFGTNENVKVLMNNRNWFMDGTFKVSPKIFYQLYTIHCLVDGNVIPCLYVLLPNKSMPT
jgi:hypothetical protein